MPAALSEEQNVIIRQAKKVITTYEDMAELIRLGAYRRGSDPAVDEAIRLYPQIEEFLNQHKDERTLIDEGFQALALILGMSYGQPVELG